MSKRIIPKKVIYECDLCGQENKDIDCFYLLKYKEWVKLIYPRPTWNERNIFICWNCFEKIKDNLYKLSKMGVMKSE